jgi:hypothetical protein
MHRDVEISFGSFLLLLIASFSNKKSPICVAKVVRGKKK